MAVPDRIELDLSTLKDVENLDRVQFITGCLKQILYSQEVTPSADETGEWPQDWDWSLDTPKIALRKVEHKTLRQQFPRK